MCKRDITYYGYITITKGTLLIAYSVEYDDNDPNSSEYFLLKADKGKKLYHDYDEFNLVSFPCEDFKMVDDLVSNTWVKKSPKLDRKVTYFSFSEWFENNFYIRAHDWNMSSSDYEIIKKYKIKYEDIYKDYLV